MLSFQSTLPVWGATIDCQGVTDASVLFQSTLPVWGATGKSRHSCVIIIISIHAPRVGSDIVPQQTVAACRISIHAPRVGSDIGAVAGTAVKVISIHAPRVGSDIRRPQSGRQNTDFNPRSPCGERRGYLRTVTRNAFISIHAPRVGSDSL